MEDPEDTIASLDLYDDLITAEGLSRQDNYDELSSKYDAAVQKIIELESKVDTLQKSEAKLSEKCGILEKNISTLFLTARLEIQRKDKAIQRYKYMRESRSQNQTASATSSRPNRVDESKQWEHYRKANDPVLVEKAKTKRRLSSDDREEKIKKKRKLSEKLGSCAGEEEVSKRNNVSRTDSCGQSVSRKILQKSKKDIQRRMSGGKSSSHANEEHDQNREREKKKQNNEDKCSAYEFSKSEKTDRREKKRKNPELPTRSEKRDEIKSKESQTKKLSGNIHFEEETKEKRAVSGEICDLREKLKMKRLRHEDKIKKDNLLESKRRPCNISKVDGHSPEEEMKSFAENSSPKENKHPSQPNRNRSRNRSSEDKSTPSKKENDPELKKKARLRSTISKPKLDCDEHANRNRKSSADKISSLDSEIVDSQSKSQGTVVSNELCTDKNLHSDKPSNPVIHVKKAISSLPSQETDDKNQSKTTLPIQTIQTGEQLKAAPTSQKVSKDEQEKQQKMCSYSVGNVNSEETSTVHISEPVLGSSVVERNRRKSGESLLSASSVLEECETDDFHIKSVSQEMCSRNLKMIENIGSGETTLPVKSCTRTSHHSKEKVDEKEKLSQENASQETSQTKLVDVKQEAGDRQTTAYTDKNTKTFSNNVEYVIRRSEELENSLNMDVDELKDKIKTDPEVNKRQSFQDQETSSCNLNIDDGEKDKQNRNSIDDVRMSTKDVRLPLSPRNVKQISVSSKSSVKIKREHGTSSPAGKSKRKPKTEAMAVSTAKNEVILSPTGRKNREKLEPKVLGTSVAAGKQKHLSQVNQKDRKIPTESKSLINVSPGSKENASVCVGFVNDWQENQSSVQLSKSERSVDKLNPDVDKFSTAGKDLIDIHTSRISIEKVDHSDNTDSEKNKEESDNESKMDSVTISSTIDDQTKVGHELQVSEKVVSEGLVEDTTGPQRDSHLMPAKTDNLETIPEMSTKDHSTMEMDLKLCGTDKINTASCGKDKFDTESPTIEKVETPIYDRTKENPDTIICEKEKLGSGLSGRKKLDKKRCDEIEESETEPFIIQNTDIASCITENIDASSDGMEKLDSESCEIEKLDTGSSKTEQEDSKINRMEKLNTEACEMEKLDTGLREIRKPGVETFEGGKQDSAFYGKDTETCKTEKQDTDHKSYIMEKLDPEYFKMEKLDTKPHGKEKIVSGPSRIDYLDTLNIEIDEKETSSLIDEKCDKALPNSKESKEFLVKSSKEQLDSDDSGNAGRIDSSDTHVNTAEEDSAGNRKRSASSVQSDSTLESDLEMSSDSESEASDEDEIIDSETVSPFDTKNGLSHEGDLDNSMDSHTSESGSDGDVHSSRYKNKFGDLLNENRFGHCSPVQDGSHSPEQNRSGIPIPGKNHTESEGHKGSQQTEKTDLQTSEQNPDIYEDLDYEYKSDSSSPSSDEEGCKSPEKNSEHLIRNERDLTEEFSGDNGAEDSQEDELMLCVSPSESMEFDTEENIEENSSKNVKAKKVISPKKKILYSRSNREDIRKTKQKDLGSVVSLETLNKRDHHNQREREPSHECSRLQSPQNNSKRHEMIRGSENNQTEEKTLKIRERKGKMTSEEKHEGHMDRKGKHDKPKISKDQRRERLSKNHDREKSSKDRQSDTENRYKDRHSNVERSYKDRHSDTERPYKERQRDMEKTYKDRHSGTERTNKDRHSDSERTYKDRHSDSERTYKERERTYKERHSEVEKPYKDHQSDSERIYKDRHSDMERTYKDRHSDMERKHKDQYYDTVKTSKDCPSDNYRGHKETVTREKKVREQLSAHKRSSKGHMSEKKRKVNSNQYDQEGNINQNPNKDEEVSENIPKHQKSHWESSEKVLPVKDGKTSEKKAKLKMARNLEHKYGSPKILRTVTSETIFSAEGSHRLTDTVEEPKSASVDNPKSQGISNVTISHNDPQIAENITISHTDQDNQRNQIDDRKVKDRLHPVLANKWSSRECENLQHNIVNITRVDSDEEDMEIRVTDSSNSCSDDFLSDVSEPEKCARVRTWQEVAKIFRENVDVLDTEEVEKLDVEERSDVENYSSDSDSSCSNSDTSSDNEESDNSCYAMESNFTFELCKNPDTISSGEDVAHNADVQPRKDLGSCVGVDTNGKTVCGNIVKSPTSYLLNRPEMYSENASDNFTDNLDDRFHNCPTNIPEKCFINEVSLEDGEILTDGEEKVEKVPSDINSRKISSCVSTVLSPAKKMKKSDKHGSPWNVGKSKHHRNRPSSQQSVVSPRKRLSKQPVVSPRKRLSQQSLVSPRKRLSQQSVMSPRKRLSTQPLVSPRKRLSKQPLVSPRPSPRKEKSPRDEMYRRKHLQTAVKVLRNKSRERKSNTSPVKVPRHVGSGKVDGTDLRDRIGDKPSRNPEDRLPLRKRKRSRSCERGSRIKHVSPRRS